MGRGKIEIKRIENLTNRQVTYSKRRSGIMKKAMEISILCNAQLSLIIFGSSGRMHDYCSPSTTLSNILDKYHQQPGAKKLWDAKHENLHNEIERLKKENDSMQVKLRQLDGKDISSLTHLELIPIEAALENGISRVRAKKMEVLGMAKKSSKIQALLEEQKHLIYELQGKLTMGDEFTQDMECGYRRPSRDYHQDQVLLAPFQTHPIQPNLHDHI